jgi:hypothetical protein
MPAARSEEERPQSTSPGHPSVSSGTDSVCSVPCRVLTSCATPLLHFRWLLRCHRLAPWYEQSRGTSIYGRVHGHNLCVTFALFGASQRASIPVSPDIITSHVVVVAHVAVSLTNGNRPATLFCVSPHRVSHSEPVEMVNSGGSAAPDSPRCQMAVVGLGGCGREVWKR